MSASDDLKTIRGLIHDGRLVEAKAGIQAVPVRRLSRRDRLQLSYLARRAHYPQKALALLHALVRADKGRAQTATEAEKAEYAGALIMIGARTEGMELLRSLDVVMLPRVVRFCAFAFFQEWDWQGAIPALEKGVALSRASVDDRLHLKLFLGSALLHGRKNISRSRELFSEVVEEARIAQHAGVRWDALQLLAQTYYFDGQRAMARRLFDQALKHYGGDRNALPALSIGMFKALIDLQSAALRTGALRTLGAIKHRLLEIGGWEKARSCDYYRALVLKDSRLMTHLYYGTPYPAFRRTLCRDFGITEAQIPRTFEFRMRGHSKAKAGGIQILNGANSWSEGRLKPGQLSQRLLQILASDFYARLPLPQVCVALYPDTYFNPKTSLDQTWQAVRGLRDWLDRERIPLKVVNEGKRCFLEASGDVTLVMQRPAITPGQDKAPQQARVLEFVLRLRSAFAGAEFRAKQVESLLGVTRPTAVALINDALAAGSLTKIAAGPQSRYRLARQSSA